MGRLMNLSAYNAAAVGGAANDVDFKLPMIGCIIRGATFYWGAGASLTLYVSSGTSHSVPAFIWGYYGATINMNHLEACAFCPTTDIHLRYYTAANCEVKISLTIEVPY